MLLLRKLLRKRPEQILASLSLAIAAGITIHCPCPRINSCHKRSFILAWLLGGGIVLYDNYA